MSKNNNKAKPDSKKKDNSIGTAEVKRSRPSAIAALAKAKELEAKQIENGYKWVTNGRESVLVAPNDLAKKWYKGYMPIKQ